MTINFTGTVRFEHVFTFPQLDALALQVFTRINEIGEKMALLHDTVQALIALVAQQTTVEQSAIELIAGFAAQLQAAVAAIVAQQAAGEAADVSDLQTLATTMEANKNALAAAVANVPAPAPTA